MQVYRDGQISTVHDSSLFNSSYFYSIIINLEKIQYSGWKSMFLSFRVVVKLGLSFPQLFSFFCEVSICLSGSRVVSALASHAKDRGSNPVRGR